MIKVLFGTWKVGIAMEGSAKGSLTQTALALAVLLVPSVFGSRPALAQNYIVVYSFLGSDDSHPLAGLIRDSVGNLYGTASSGGASSNGAVFKLDTSYTETVLHSFTGVKDGAVPAAGLIHDLAGNFYGTTQGGGDLACDRFGCGTVFRLNAAGKYKLLYRFVGGTDGKFPSAGLVRDDLGNLYGTTSQGGPYGYGTVFKLDPTGTETVLHSFAGGPEGAFPQAGLVLDQATGNLYGTTNAGANGGGALFELDPSGNLTSLYVFNGLDGANPYASLLRDAAGNLYGTTANGGASGDGTVFELDTTGAEIVLHSFTGVADGSNPRAPLIQDAKGTLYGTAVSGGAGGLGVVFKMDPISGKVKVLHSFAGGTTDGNSPLAGLIPGRDGFLYGTTYLGGAVDEGTVFRIAP